MVEAAFRGGFGEGVPVRSCLLHSWQGARRAHEFELWELRCQSWLSKPQGERGCP